MRDFERAFRPLPSLQREALTLVGASGFSYVEAAKIAGSSCGTMKSRISRAGARLQQTLDGDGAAALCGIKGAGGISIAQRPETAAHPEMRESATSNGCVDFVLSPDDIALTISRIIAGAAERPRNMSSGRERRWGRKSAQAESRAPRCRAAWSGISPAKERHSARRYALICRDRRAGSILLRFQRRLLGSFGCIRLLLFAGRAYFAPVDRRHAGFPLPLRGAS